MNEKEKFLLKISIKDRLRILQALNFIMRGDLTSLDVKKLKGTSNIFRVRVGNYRIFYEVMERKNIILKIDRRNDHTY